LSYVNPNTGTEDLLLNNNHITTAGDNISLNFNQGKAIIVLKYDDAGKINLKAEYDSTDPDTNETVNMEGYTEFIVKPLGFYIYTSDSNPEAFDASGGVFKKAGEYFNFQADAVCWTSSTDSDNDGYLDEGADASSNIVTKNYISQNIFINHNFGRT